MFDNIGATLKTLAKVILYGGIALSVFGGLGCILVGLDYLYLDPSQIVIGVLYIVIGPLVSLFSALLIYGFGQLIENTDILTRWDNEDNT